MQPMFDDLRQRTIDFSISDTVMSRAKLYISALMEAIVDDDLRKFIDKYREFNQFIEMEFLDRAMDNSCVRAYLLGIANTKANLR